MSSFLSGRKPWGSRDAVLTPPTHRIHALMGVPVSAQCVAMPAFRCWVCAGAATRGVLVESWLGSNFVGQNRVRCPESTNVCEACVVCMAGRPPDTLRMTSHLVDDCGWLRLNKGGKTEMRAWLRGPKLGDSFACVADTGQKHLLPWAPVNPHGAREYRVLFEERAVTVGDWGLVDDLTTLLTAGATKEEIGRGEYGPRAWDLCGAALRRFESAYAGERSGGWFELSLWLAQRDEAAVEARMTEEKAERTAKKERTHASGRRKGKAALPERRDAPRDAGRVPVDGGRVA